MLLILYSSISPVLLYVHVTGQNLKKFRLKFFNLGSTFYVFSFMYRQGHPTGNLEKKTWKQQQSMNKAFWSHFKHFGRLLGKIYLFPTPSKTDGRVPSQQGAPTTYNLTYWEVSQQMYIQTLLGSLAVVIGQNSGLSLEGGGGENDKKLGGDKGFWQIAHSSCSRHQISSDTLHCPSQEHFPSKDILFFPNLPASKNWPVEQIFWGTDPMGVPVS